MQATTSFKPYISLLRDITHSIELIYSNYLAMALITLGHIDDTIKMHLRCHFSGKHTQTQNLAIYYCWLASLSRFRLLNGVKQYQHQVVQNSIGWLNVFIHDRFNAFRSFKTHVLFDYSNRWMILAELQERYTYQIDFVYLHSNVMNMNMKKAKCY